MKKFFALLLASAMALSVVSCGNQNTPSETKALEVAPPITQETESKEPESKAPEGVAAESRSLEKPEQESSESAPSVPSSTPDVVSSEPLKPDESSNSSIDVEKNLFTVELTIPSDFFDESTTQESLDELAAEYGYKSVTLNDDGSVTYFMTKQQHAAILAATKEAIDESLVELAEDDSFPSIDNIKANNNYTSFEVVLSTDTVEMLDGLVAYGLFAFGGYYNAFAGNEVGDISVDFISQATGEVIHTANSNS